jgi:transposase
MAHKRISCMEIRQLLQLKMNGQSNRLCAETLQINRNTINDYVAVLKQTGMPYSELFSKTDLELRELFPQADTKDSERYQVLAEYLPQVYADRSLPGFTLQNCWSVYKENHPDGYGFTQFTMHYKRLYKKPKTSMPQVHIAGQTVFVDYAGTKAKIVNKETGEIIEVELFVAILPWSNYTFVEASYSQKKEDFIGSMNRCLSFFGGSPVAVVPDNLKSAVTKASKYEPYINKTFKSFGIHYNTVIHPARPYKAKDKALVEGAVKLCYQRILFSIRNMTFFSIDELNIEIRKRLDIHNRTNFQDRDYSRLDLFLKTEKQLLRPLPAQHFMMRDYKWLTVNLSAHVKLSEDKHYYSVPADLVGKKVEMQYSQETVEIYRDSKRVAIHKRKPFPGYSTREEHLEKGHQEYSKWNEDYFVEKAQAIGPVCQQFITKLIHSKEYPPQAFRQVHGIIMLKRLYANNRIENACRIGLITEKYSYKGIEEILKKGLDFNYRELFDEAQPNASSHIPLHENTRGNHYS